MGAAASCIWGLQGITGLLCASGLLGCSGVVSEPAPAGEGCPAWTRADGDGCSARGWQVSEPGLGEGATTTAVELDPGGRAWLAWQQGFYGGTALVVAREGDDGWTLTSPTAGASVPHHSDPRMAIAGDGTMLFAWEGSSAHASTRARVVTASGAWTVPPGGEVFSFPDYGWSHDVAAGPEGELLLVWNQSLDNGYKRGVCVARRGPGETAFDRPASPWEVLSNTVFFSNSPRLVRNRRGDAVIVWFESVGNALSVFASERWGLDGSFSRPGKERALSPLETEAEQPHPAIAEDGSAAVVWWQPRGDGIAVYLAERDARGTWSKPASLGDSFSPAADFIGPLAVQFSERGDLYVMWEQAVADDSAVMLAHRTPDGRWLAPGSAAMRLSGEGRKAVAPSLVVTPSGGVMALWREEIDGVWRAVARRGTIGEGAREEDRWAAPEPLSRIELGDAGSPVLAAGGPHDRAMAAWSQDGSVYYATLD